MVESHKHEAHPEKKCAVNVVLLALCIAVCQQDVSLDTTAGRRQS